MTHPHSDFSSAFEDLAAPFLDSGLHIASQPLPPHSTTLPLATASADASVPTLSTGLIGKHFFLLSRSFC